MPAKVIDRKSFLWSYMTTDIKDLLEDGELLFKFVAEYKDKTEISDFSFLVFPFAKAYEGFLKKFFFDLGVISYEDFYGDEVRIGRILNPNYLMEHGSVLDRMCRKDKKFRDFSEVLWATWKKGRNRVFHYFPHNFRKLSFEEADDIIGEMINVMEMATDHCRLSIGDYTKK